MAAVEEQLIVIDEWRGLYGESWKGVIGDEAFAHPAKFSRALIRKIYDHVIAEGWATKGSSVVDPFGGVALGGFDAMRHGLNWYGCELEQKFVELGGRNIDLWNGRYSRMPNWGTARLIQGDSRKLINVLREASCCVTSPPYANDTVNERNGIDLSLIKKPGGHNSQSRKMSGYGEASGQLGAMKEGDHSHALVVSSPPYAAISPEKSSSSVDYAKQYETYRSQGGGASFEKFVATQKLHSAGYGDSDGQLSAMKAGDHSIAISSPPYIEGLGHGGAPTRGAGRSDDKNLDAMQNGYGETKGQLGAMPEGDLCVTSPPYNPPMSQDHNGTRGGQRGTTPSEKGAFVKYGNSEGQLEGMSMEGFDAAISSPPYARQMNEGGNTPTAHGLGRNTRQQRPCEAAGKHDLTRGYGDTQGQIGHMDGETFWSASRLILEQLHQVLSPNAHAVFVVKAFVRNKQIVDFPAQWAQLCEAVGFKLLHHHHALLTEHYGTQGGFDEDRELKIKRASFFRRLAEAKGSPSIDWENVLCFVKER